MDRKPVKSSQIKSIGFDSETSTLEVEFASESNPIWHYQPITPEGFNEMMKAESVGKYFHAHVKTNQLVTAKRIS